MKDRKSRQKKKRGQTLTIVIFLAGIIILIGGNALHIYSAYSTGIGLALIILGILFQTALKRCPNCGRILRDIHENMGYCPYCGHKLNGENESE